MYNVVVGGPIHRAGLDLLRSRGDVRLEVLGDSTTETLAANVADADGVLLRLQTMDRALIGAAPRLKIVSRNGVGFDTVDVDALSERSIPLAVAGDVNSGSVAEHTMMLVLATAKRVMLNDRGVRSGNWRVRDTLAARDVEGKTILIVGFGRIGRKVARLASAFAMRVVAFDPHLDADAIRAAGAEPAGELASGLGQADFVSLHAPGAGAGPLIGKAELAAMKPSAILINTSRGSHVDERALADALGAGRIAGAGLDVFAPEPPAANNPLFALDNVVLSPHIAGFTEECAARMGRDAAQNLLDGLDGTLDPARVVNAAAVGLVAG